LNGGDIKFAGSPRCTMPRLTPIGCRDISGIPFGVAGANEAGVPPDIGGGVRGVTNCDPGGVVPKGVMPPGGVTLPFEFRAAGGGPLRGGSGGAMVCVASVRKVRLAPPAASSASSAC